jgi:hypothetical protein
MRSFIIGIAALFELGGLACGCGGNREGDVPKAEVAKLTVDKFAFEAGPQWMLSTQKECPESLLEIAQLVGKDEKDTIDPWGTPYKLYCGKDSLPPAVHNGLAVVSFGPDKKEHTEDDITSWQQRDAR